MDEFTDKEGGVQEDTDTQKRQLKAVVSSVFQFTAGVPFSKDPGSFTFV